jgi:hypothetical protein
MAGPTIEYAHCNCWVRNRSSLFLLSAIAVTDRSQALARRSLGQGPRLLDTSDRTPELRTLLMKGMMPRGPIVFNFVWTILSLRPNRLARSEQLSLFRSGSVNQMM